MRSLVIMTTSAISRLEQVTKEMMPDKLFGAKYIEESIEECFANENRILRVVP